jgi:hypothetical protein
LSRPLCIAVYAICLAGVLFSAGAIETHGTNNSVSGVCAAFAEDGTLATGTLLNGKLETKLYERDVVSATTQEAMTSFAFRGLLQSCEEAFSSDGKWLATTVTGSDLVVVILDRATKAIHRKFSIAWNQLHSMPVEPMYRSSFLGGFLEDDSLALWRYVPNAVANSTDASNTNLHLQRWSLEGELLSEKDLGSVGAGPGRLTPIPAAGFNAIWIPSKCEEVPCYREAKVLADKTEGGRTLRLPHDNSAEPVPLPGNERFLSVLGRTAQEAVLFDSSGQLMAQVALPFFPNLFGPLVPDWFTYRKPAVSQDGTVAAVGRTRVAWVLVDTDRDWGSEVIVLKLHPLAVLATLKTGKGGIRTVAVDHRDGFVRVVSFWNEQWHEMKCDDVRPSGCHWQRMPTKS